MYLSKAEKPLFTEFILFAKPSVGLAPTTAEEKEKKQNKLCGSYLKTVTWFAGERQISTGRVPRKLETDMRTCTALTPSSGIEPPGGILPHLAMESNHTHSLLSVFYSYILSKSAAHALHKHRRTVLTAYNLRRATTPKACREF